MYNCMCKSKILVCSLLPNRTHGFYQTAAELQASLSDFLQPFFFDLDFWVLVLNWTCARSHSVCLWCITSCVRVFLEGLEPNQPHYQIPDGGPLRCVLVCLCILYGCGCVCLGAGVQNLQSGWHDFHALCGNLSWLFRCVPVISSSLRITKLQQLDCFSITVVLLQHVLYSALHQH